MPPCGKETDTSDLRPSRTKKSAESFKFDSALTSLKRQRSKKEKDDNNLVTKTPEKATFKLVSDTESDSDSFLEDVTKSARRNEATSGASIKSLSNKLTDTASTRCSKTKKSNKLPNIRSPTSLRTSKIAFACKRCELKNNGRKISESQHEQNKAKNDRNSIGTKSSRRKRSVASSFMYSDSSDNELRIERNKVGRQSKDATQKRTSERKRSNISSFYSSSDSSDSEIGKYRSLTSDSAFRLLRGKPKTDRKVNKKKSDEFLPLTSDLSSSDIDEAEFSSFLGHLVGNDYDERKSNKVKPAKYNAIPTETSDSEDNDIAILDYIISGKKDKAKVKAKDIKFPDTSSTTKSRQGSLTNFFLGKGNKGKKNPASVSATVTQTSSQALLSDNLTSIKTTATPKQFSSPSLQDSSVTDDVLVQALDTAENAPSRPSEAIDNTRSQKSAKICRKPGLSRPAVRSSGRTKQGGY